MAKGSGMIHPNMATMLGVLTTDAQVRSDVWREMVRTSVSRSFNQITVVDGDTSTNDCVIAMASGLSGLSDILTHDSAEAQQLQACLDAVMQGLAKSIAWDGEGATCLIEVKWISGIILLTLCIFCIISLLGVWDTFSCENDDLGLYFQKNNLSHLATVSCIISKFISYISSNIAQSSKVPFSYAGYCNWCK
uniref:Glutamate N-acetyltransferase n=1 Tax=Aegilops tauschii subsp. strangulata TaxID=200361 RepID=A0A453ICV4_AEGTS